MTLLEQISNIKVEKNIDIKMNMLRNCFIAYIDFIEKGPGKEFFNDKSLLDSFKYSLKAIETYFIEQEIDKIQFNWDGISKYDEEDIWNENINGHVDSLIEIGNMFKEVLGEQFTLFSFSEI